MCPIVPTLTWTFCMSMLPGCNEQPNGVCGPIAQSLLRFFLHYERNQGVESHGCETQSVDRKVSREVRYSVRHMPIAQFRQQRCGEPVLPSCPGDEKSSVSSESAQG